MNPYVDGFINQKGKSIDISELVNKVNPNSPTNLMDEIMLAYGLENGKRWNQPEIYYQPQFNEEFNKVVYDPNFLSWIGESTAQDAMSYFKKKKIQFEAVMKLRKGKHFYISTGQEKFIETPTLKEFCDLIFSAKKLYCLTSGTATLSSALQKKATVFYGNGQPAGFRHDKNHEYILVPRYLNNRLKKKLKLS